MKNLQIRLVPVLLLALATSTFAQRISAPNSPSTTASVSQTIGISTITVKYSRPYVKGREIWGALVPYGWNRQGFGNNAEAPWRAGANENTVIEFTHPAKVEGKTVPAGSYGLFFVINKDNTGEVILSNDYRSWGSFFYEATHDRVKAPIKIRDIAHTEMLTYDFINVDKTSCELVLNWEKKQFPVKIEFDVNAIVMANAVEELKGPIGFGWQGPNSAASYALQNKTNLEQGLAWSEIAVTRNSNFTTLSTKSGLLTATGKKAEADDVMKKAMAVATEAELNTYGYQLLGNNEHDKAIEIFVTVTERFPNSANAWDSLGEGYATKGDKKNAVKSFKKALSLNPPPNVKANSEKFLKQFGEI
jgi:hypothetical protein